MASEGDTFRTPSDPRHEFRIAPHGSDATAELGGIDNVTVITLQGSDLYPADVVAVDRLKLNPRIGGKTVGSLIRDANARWALEGDPKEASDA